jgi:hypothetical protein
VIAENRASVIPAAGADRVPPAPTGASAERSNRNFMDAARFSLFFGFGLMQVVERQGSFF